MTLLKCVGLPLWEWMNAEALVYPNLQELPCVLLHGHDPKALLRHASRMTAVAFGRDAMTDCFAPLRCPGDEQVSVQLPAACPWGGGTKVSVRRVNSGAGCDAVLVYVPHADDAGTSSAHLARCAGVLEVCKEACDLWCISMCRKVVVVHMVCCLPPAVLLALAHVIERSVERALFILTCSRPAVLPRRLHSLAQCARLGSGAIACELSPGVNVARAVAAGTVTPRQVVERLSPDTDECCAANTVQAAADAEHLAARLQALGVSVDSPDCRAALAAYFTG